VEFAALAAKRHRLEEAAPTSRAARAALRNSSELTLLLAGSQLGITACTLALGAISKPAVHHWLTPLFTSWGLPLVAADVVALPIRNDAYDVALAPHMLYHVEDRVGAAHELRRVLAPDGRCIAVTNGEANQQELVAMVEHVVGNGWHWHRQDRAFTLENGAVPLATAFDQVERIDAPASAVHVTDADVFAGYIASVGDLYEPQVSSWIAWADVVDECRHRVAAIVARDGAFVVSSVFGAFVCR